MKAVRIHQVGPPDVLRYEDVPSPLAAEDAAIVRLTANGVNFIDVYYRSGVYPLSLPATLGTEGAGEVTAVGERVNLVKVGDRVAYSNAMGSYAEYHAVPAWKLVKIPEGLDERMASAVLLQGMTAHYLSHDTFPLKKGQRALIHAGAGGVGALLIQMASQIGVEVVATASTQAKAALAREAGAGEVILYTQNDFEEEVKRITNGVGVDVVYDSVGKATFEKSMRCLTPRGMLVQFGQSSGVVAPVSTMELARGSFFLTRPMLRDYTATREEFVRRATEVFEMVRSGRLEVRVMKDIPLSQAAEAHRLLEARQTTGKLLLIP